ncbi:MAG TPA: cyclase family protein [Steroidobacteraceae bacterium]|nr:cyclase family protein [Steroidobacteraceae bacterium]
MILEVTGGGRRWRADAAAPVDLAIELQFDGPQPRFFADRPARAEPLRCGGFTGSLSTGASCNCGQYTLAPHCHGTHTECVGHLTDDGTSISSLTPVSPALALLISVAPEPLGAAGSHPLHAAPDDRVLTRDALAGAARDWLEEPWSALVVRTLPNPPQKRHRRYQGAAPAPYFTAEAMRWVVERNVTSLVVDLPSLDRADDGGQLEAHRTFWGLAAGARSAAEARRAGALVTELAYVPEPVSDGLYLLDLQVPAFAADAAPSRPVVFPLIEVLS